ncbi:hypothetical protein JVT61DRAFT_6268 [Boletus reticuloceps]|uniref:Uncharacterized protein n=1 Tax=Boletus reticuloceps TaxID=495285 RepID=A0A8I2YLQ9_9AGAM|nr:hypothetical protein JVT61DRAFT_6268 [Boletus reticuloceps]
MAGKARSNADVQKTPAPNAVPAPRASQGGMPPNKWHGRGSKAAPGPMSAPAPPTTALSSTSADVSAPDPLVPPTSKKTLTANITWDGRCTDLLVWMMRKEMKINHIPATGATSTKYLMGFYLHYLQFTSPLFLFTTWHFPSKHLTQPAG